MSLKRWGVNMLEAVCAAVDKIPAYRRGSGWVPSCWGCWPLGLARRAVLLDERWETGVWGP